MNNWIAVTAINAVLLAMWFFVLRYSRIRWRILLAMLPTPMLGFASSYGVFAYNAHFAPSLIAIAMAAAYEITYVGIASYTTINTRQRAEGEKISRDAAWISFIQNGLAGLVFIQPDVLGYNKLGGFWPLAINVPLAALHAAQVWIAYRASRFTMHGVQTKEVDEPKVVNVDKNIDVLPAPQVDNTMPKVDKNAATWLDLYESGMTFAAISESLGGKPSRQYIQRHVALYRDSLVSEVE